MRNHCVDDAAAYAYNSLYLDREKNRGKNSDDVRFNLHF
jgi:hypothetical protein